MTGDGGDDATEDSGEEVRRPNAERRILSSDGDCGCICECDVGSGKESVLGCGMLSFEFRVLERCVECSGSRDLGSEGGSDLFYIRRNGWRVVCIVELSLLCSNL